MIARTIAVLAIVLAQAYSANAAAGDPDIQRALATKKLEEEGFINKLDACDMASSYYHQLMGEDPGILTNHEFIRNKEKMKEYMNLKIAYSYPDGVTQDLMDKYLKNPLTVRIKHFFQGEIKAFLEDVKKGGSGDRIDNVVQPCIGAYFEFFDAMGSNLIENAAAKKRKMPELDKSSHDKCIDAKDYEGCMRVNSSAYSSHKGKEQDDCSANGLCTVTSRGVDVFGLPKPMGWYYSQGEERISYFADPGRIPHKGQETRYLGLPRINRYYQNPEAGTSGSFIGGNTASTSCINVGSSVNCTTTGASPSYISGTSATPGGVRSIRFTTVYDCQDNTYASYKNGSVWIEWKTADRKRQKKGFIGLLKGRCERGDQYIQKEMKVLDLKL